MEYKKIYKEFYKNSKFKKMGKEIHHGTTRLAHTTRVAGLSYKISKILGCDYKSTTRGALMHDFFLTDEFESKKRLQTHPLLAYKNSLKYFSVNDLERDIILKHMFPITKKSPKYKESYIVSICDKLVSIYEFCRFQLSTTACIFLIFTLELFK